MRRAAAWLPTTTAPLTDGSGVANKKSKLPSTIAAAWLIANAGFLCRYPQHGQQLMRASCADTRSMADNQCGLLVPIAAAWPTTNAGFLRRWQRLDQRAAAISGDQQPAKASICRKSCARVSRGSIQASVTAPQRPKKRPKKAQGGEHDCNLAE